MSADPSGTGSAVGPMDVDLTVDTVGHRRRAGRGDGWRRPINRDDLCVAMVAGEPCGHGPVAATEVDDFGAISLPLPRSRAPGRRKRDRGGEELQGQVREQETRTDIDAGPGSENATVSRDGGSRSGWNRCGAGLGWVDQCLSCGR